MKRSKPFRHRPAVRPGFIAGAATAAHHTSVPLFLLVMLLLVSASALADPIVTDDSAALIDALQQAPDGSVIRLGEGLFEARIDVARGLTLVGAGPGKTILRPLEEDGAPPVRIRSGGSLKLHDLTIESEGEGAVVQVDGGVAPGPGVHSLSLVNGCLTGGNRPGSVGVLVDGTGGPVSVLLDSMIVEKWDTAIRTLGAGAAVTVRNSALTPNLTAAFDNSGSGAAQDARYNWWGAADGPSGAGPGTGEAVLGAFVTFSPWRLVGTDLDPECGFQPPDNLVYPGPSDTCLSTANPCVTIPVYINRLDIADIRAFSVTIQLSPELALCTGPGDIVEGTYLSAVNPSTDFHVIDNGGGSYTVDDAILGLPCGATAPTGLLFTVRVTRTVASGTGTLSITEVLLRDCVNGPVPSAAGPPTTVTIDAIPTGPVTGLSATQVKTGNDSDGTTKVKILFTPPAGSVSVSVFRAPFGNYPEYDDAPGAGSVPAVPAWPPGPPWVLTPITASGQDDETAVRDFWFYVAFAVDSCGNVSAPSARAGGVLNYHLGDFHDGFSDCAGDNLVTTADLSFLGANYGITLGVSDPLGCLDVGPTTNFTVNARPVTDNLVDFEDLIMLALNYGLVSKPSSDRDGGPAPVSGPDRVTLATPADPRAGETLRIPIEASGSGAIRGLSIALDVDPAGLAIESVEAGDLLNRQGRPAAVLRHGAGTVDVALLGEGPGLRGAGELVVLTARVMDPARASLRVSRIMARDGDNRAVDVLDGRRPGEALPPVTRLRFVEPVAGGGAEIGFSLAAAGPVDLTVFNVLGRRIRTLMTGSLDAGDHQLSWDGRDERGVPAAGGLYFIRFDSSNSVDSRRILLAR